MLLGVTDHILRGSDIHVKFRNDDELIVSPRRKHKKGSRSGRVVCCSTPRTLRNRSQEQNSSRPQLNESMLSGYDGDREDDLDDSLISLDEIDGDFGDCKAGMLSDEGMGSESDTMFGNLSNDSARSPQKMNFSFSFSMKSPSHRLSFTNQNIFCDIQSTSSGVSSSQSSGCADDEDNTASFSNSQSFSLFSSLKSTSMTLRSASASAACANGFFSSDSESNTEGAPNSKRFRNSSSPKHMTLRDSTRKHRRQGSYGSKTYIFK